MKKYCRLLLLATGLIVILIGAYYKGAFSKFNVISAYYGILSNDYKIAYIGELGMYEKQEWVVAPKLGFKIDRTYDCNVNNGTINGVHDFNKIMGNYIDKHVCVDWQKKLANEAKELFIQDSIAISIVECTELKTNRTDIIHNTDISLSVDKRDSLFYQLSGSGYNDSLHKSFKYFEITVDLKNRKVENVRNTLIELE